MKMSSLLLTFCLLLVVSQSPAKAQDKTSAKDLALYSEIKSFSLTGGAVDVNGLVIKKDRAQITLAGTVYLAAQKNGQIIGAVFIGEGTFALETPPTDFEQANIRRLTGMDTIKTDFKTAVFRFTDDTAQQLGTPRSAPLNERAQKLAQDVEPKLLKELGLNLSSRIAQSILNQEKPGLFYATFDGGKRGRFNLILDHQTRIPVNTFDINGGEKGIVYAHSSLLSGPEVWTAFYSLDDYQRGSVEYSDKNDLIDIQNYDMVLDLRDHKKHLNLKSRIDAQALATFRVLDLKVGEDLSDDDDWRLNKQLRVKSLKVNGNDAPFVQEDWEGGFAVFLSDPISARSKFVLEIELDGDFIEDANDEYSNCHYPRSNQSWFPRHGYLDRATFNLTYRHPKKLHIASSGLRISEDPDPEDKDAVVTKYQMAQPVPLVTFALAPFQRHADTINWDNGAAPIPLEFNSLSSERKAVNEKFILQEMSNSVRYFNALFGAYPYPAFSAALHPFGFGQGFPSLLMIPSADDGRKQTYQFIAHETAHQWWGGIVAWRSYRDQWLSEGFAEYSGILFTGRRLNVEAQNDLLRWTRNSLTEPPSTVTGLGKGRLVDVGPIILGHRLFTRKTTDAYEALIYAKGALVLRMLHFLLSDPQTGDYQPFFDMMTDFVNRYRNKTASTDNFRLVANEHFARSPIARTFNIPNLNWLFKQEVYETALPSYELQYQIKDQPDGKVIVSGTISQANAPNDWIMVLPVKFSFGEKQMAIAPVLVTGPYSVFQIYLPARPKKVELDPEHWIIADKVTTTAK